MIFNWFLVLFRSKDRVEYPVEHRCDVCVQRKDCPAYDTGVSYPCPYFQEQSSSHL